MKLKLTILLILVGCSFAGGLYLGKQDKPKIETKEVVKYKERVRTRTVIKERPDGTKETIIVEDKNTKGKRIATKKVSKPDWSIGVSSTIKKDPIYGAQVERRIIGDIWLGGYARTDKEFGVSLRFDF
jgi:hypothetical protein